MASGVHSLLRTRPMFRITKAEQSSCTLLTVEGDLAGDSLAAVDVCCEEAMEGGRPVTLLLKDVFTIDAAGRELLRKLAAAGVRLRGTGVYTSYLLRSLGTAEVRAGRGR
jgi:hypothetical protein